MSDRYNNDLETQYNNMSDEALMQIVTIFRNNYRPEAIDIAKMILSKRGINDSSMQLNNNVYQQKDNKQEKPIQKKLLKVLSYIIWVIGWFLLIGFYGLIKGSMMKTIAYFIMDLGFTNISTISSICGIISSLITILFFYVFYKGIRFIASGKIGLGGK